MDDGDGWDNGDGADDFEAATAVRPVGDGRFTADITPGWDVRGNPHGGYLLALVTRAMGAVVTQPDPLSVSASYVAPPQFGPAELDVAVIRAGRRQSTVTVRLVQNGVACVHAVATFGTLPDGEPEVFDVGLDAPSLPAPELCSVGVFDEAEGAPIALHQRLDLRFHPDTGWLRGEPSGRPEVVGWMRLRSKPAADSLALLMFSDGMPPSIFEMRGRTSGHTPTVQLTTHLFARPTPGWVQGRFRTRVVGGSFLDEDGELWDSHGTLLATTRQLALIRTPQS